MIAFSENVKQLLSEPVVESFYLLKVHTGYFKTSFYTDINVGGVDYVADGSIVSVEPPQLISVVDKQLFKFSINDLNGDLSSIAEGGLIGVSVEVRAAFVDPTTKQPLTNLSDTLLIYKGTIDSTSRIISTSAVGSSVFNITCSSPMADLDLTRAYYTSQDYLDKNYPGDNSYEQVYQGSGPIALKWGKE